ncbi:unnamed protein product [Symbiodinium microadriaticum]|nr:unnamed protein product [Symbiodinium microadriaticum]
MAPKQKPAKKPAKKKPPAKQPPAQKARSGPSGWRAWKAKVKAKKKAKKEILKKELKKEQVAVKQEPAEQPHQMVLLDVFDNESESESGSPVDSQLTSPLQPPCMLEKGVQTDLSIDAKAVIAVKYEMHAPRSLLPKSHPFSPAIKGSVTGDGHRLRKPLQGLAGEIAVTDPSPELADEMDHATEKVVEAAHCLNDLLGLITCGPLRIKIQLSEMAKDTPLDSAAMRALKRSAEGDSDEGREAPGSTGGARLRNLGDRPFLGALRTQAAVEAISSMPMLVVSATTTTTSTSMLVPPSPAVFRSAVDAISVATTTTSMPVLVPPYPPPAVLSIAGRGAATTTSAPTSRAAAANEALAKFLKHWSPSIQLQHHNLHAENMSRYNVTCVPKVWLVLSGLYRSLKYVRPTMLDMLRRSAGDCWFVTLLSSSKESQSQPLELLEDDFRFFEGRLGFMSITRHGPALEKWYNYPIHWYGCWLIAHVIRETLPQTAMDASRTIVLRHRPDECFRHCFDVDAAGRVFARHKYMILGQPVSADNGLTTNWATYADIIAAGLRQSPTARPLILQPDKHYDLYHAAWSSSWSRSEFCHGMLHPDVCLGTVPYCLMNNNTLPCRPPLFLSWQQHCLCRLKQPGTGNESAWCIDSNPPGEPLKETCLDITKDTKCILPMKLWRSLPEKLLPPLEQLKGGLIHHRNIDYMKPDKGFLECKSGRDL